MQVTVRSATDDDLTWIEQAVHTCPHTLAEMGGFYGAAATKLPPLLSPERELLIAERDGERVGFVDVDAEVDGPGSHCLNLTYFVLPSHRRRGLARDALLTVAARYPTHALVANINPDNVASLGVSRAAGFAEVGANEWGDVVLRRAPEAPLVSSHSVTDPLGDSVT